MTGPAEEFFRQEALDTPGLAERLRAHDPLLADRLEAIERERASVLLALMDEPEPPAHEQLMARIRVLRRDLARLMDDCITAGDGRSRRGEAEATPGPVSAFPTWSSTPITIPVERLASECRAVSGVPSTLGSARATSLPVWTLTALVLVTAWTLFSFGPLPALTLAAVWIALEVARWRRRPAVAVEAGVGLDGLLQGLDHGDGIKRQATRRRLVQLGGAEVVAALVGGLASERKLVRWECAKALWAMPAADTAEALVGVLLQDQEDHGVQWIAAETLTLQRARGVRALLRALEARPDAPTLISGARYVMRQLREDAQLGQIVTPVFQALDRSEPEVHAPSAAHFALRALDGLEAGSERALIRQSPAGGPAAPEPRPGRGKDLEAGLQRWADDGGVAATPVASSRLPVGMGPVS